MKVKDLIKGIEIKLLDAPEEKNITGICSDTRFIEPKNAFVAIAGNNSDGHDYINEALDSKAGLIIAEKERSIPMGYDRIYVEDSRKALSKIAANFYETSSHKLKVIGITGTNGKTTIATLLYQLFNQLKIKSGLISTIEIDNGKIKIPSRLTTPDPITIHKIMAEMVKNKCQYCFMEVSSHALTQARVSDVKFSGAVFTNISHDHLDYHKTFKEYINAKKLLFDGLEKEAIALLNADEKHYQKMQEHCQASIKTYATQNMADYEGKMIEASMENTHVSFNGNEFYSPLVGRFNIKNLLAIYATASEFLPKNKKILTEMSRLTSPCGRFEKIKTSKGVFGIVDYAHTPDALKNVLSAINEIKKKGQKVITIVGCGGNRDATKRPLMAQIAAQNSDEVILTSDNPRYEPAQKIIEDMQKGISDTIQNSVFSLIDRKNAIKEGHDRAKAGNILLIAGKGHENYQEIEGKRNPFDDKEELLKL